MIARCTRIISPTSRQTVASHPGIRIGHEYPILEVITVAERKYFRVPGPRSTYEETEFPSLWDARMFQVTNGRLPRCWILSFKDGEIQLTAKEWSRPGFWEDFYDGVDSAVFEYQRIKAQILAEPSG